MIQEPAHDPEELIDDRDEAIEDTSEPTVCKECGSPDIGVQPRGLYFIVTAILLIVFGFAGGFSEVAFFGIFAAGLVFLMAGRWRCHECGESWS